MSVTQRDDWPPDYESILGTVSPQGRESLCAEELGACSQVRHRDLADALMAALLRYAAKTDDRPWCNPATWLNGGDGLIRRKREKRQWIRARTNFSERRIICQPGGHNFRNDSSRRPEPFRQTHLLPGESESDIRLLPKGRIAGS